MERRGGPVVFVRQERLTKVVCRLDEPRGGLLGRPDAGPDHDVEPAEETHGLTAGFVAANVEALAKPVDPHPGPTDQHAVAMPVKAGQDKPEWAGRRDELPHRLDVQLDLRKLT